VVGSRPLRDGCALSDDVRPRISSPAAGALDGSYLVIVTIFRVVLADDHRLTASALADSLRSHGADVVAVAHTAAEALRFVAKKKPDVLITDLDMGQGPNGIDLAQRVAKSHPTTGIVLLTAYEDPKLLSNKIATIPAHAVYVVKHRIGDVAELLEAVERAWRYANKLEKTPTSAKRFALSTAQADLLRLIAQGLSNQAIADELNLTVGTVTTSIYRLSKKFDLGSTEERNVRAALTQKYYDYVGFQRR